MLLIFVYTFSIIFLNNTFAYNMNPKTGDIMYWIIILLFIAFVAIGFTIVYTKKKKRDNKKI